MEHLLNGQYVLRRQLFYYKELWFVYLYFISFILEVSIFVCYKQHCGLFPFRKEVKKRPQTLKATFSFIV